MGRGFEEQESDPREWVGDTIRSLYSLLIDYLLAARPGKTAAATKSSHPWVKFGGG